MVSDDEIGKAGGQRSPPLSRRQWNGWGQFRRRRHAISRSLCETDDPRLLAPVIAWGITAMRRRCSAPPNAQLPVIRRRQSERCRIREKHATAQQIDASVRAKCGSVNARIAGLIQRARRLMRRRAASEGKRVSRNYAAISSGESVASTDPSIPSVPRTACWNASSMLKTPA